MNKFLKSKTAKSARRNIKHPGLIECLESRAYFSSVVFGTPQSFSTASAGISPAYTDLVDLNGDHFADLVTANTNNSASILFGKGDGTFTLPAQNFPLSFTPLTVVDGSLDPSGKTDVVIGSMTSSAVAVILQNANGTFSKQELSATMLTNTQSVTIGNFGNGRQDIAVASFDAGSVHNVAIFMNNGDGTFAPAQVVSVSHHSIASITSFTTSGGVTDLAVADSQDSAVTVLVNNGTGNFSVGADYSLGAGATPFTIKAGTFNLKHDSNDDLVTANGTSGNVSVLLGNGNGTFQSTPMNTTVPGVASGSGLLKVRVANLDADNNPDLLGLLSPGAGVAGDAVVLLGNGDGTFHVGNTISTGGGVRTAIAAGDLNGDGLTDLVLANSSQVTALLNTTSQDTTPPTASVNITPPAVTLGSPTIQFTVTYSDIQQVDATTISAANITVVDPHGNPAPVTIVSTNLVSGPDINVTYQIQTPSGSLSPADDGFYAVSATSDPTQAVKNANQLALAAGSIGQFQVEAPAPADGPNLVAGVVRARLPASVVSGVSRSLGGESVLVQNTGDQVAKGKIVINLYASPDQTIRGNAPLLASITRIINIKVGGKAVYPLPAFKWPAGLSGQFFLVADVDANAALAETNFADNVGISSTATQVVPPFVDIDNLWSMRMPATFKVGRRIVLPVLIKNVGNVLARNTATVTLLASPDGLANDAVTLGTPSLRLSVGPGQRAVGNVVFTVPATITPGSYHLLLTISFPGDTNAANDTVVSNGTFTI